MDFYSLVRKRRSVRRFTEKKVSMSIVEKIISDATYAPTPCNQQLWKFIAITDNKVKNKLVSSAYSSTIIRRAPVVLVVCYDSWSKKEAIQASSMAVQNILLSATNHGVGSLSMNSYGNDKIIKKLLGIPKNYLINCFVLLGYPTDIYNETPEVSRRPVNQVLSINKFKSFFSTTRSYNSKDWSKEKLIDYQRYYCRKTFLGKEMDIMDDNEKILVKRILERTLKQKEKVVDFFSYDGSLLQLFPKANISSINLDKETERYVKSAVKIYCPEKAKEFNYYLYDNISSKKFDVSTMIFKSERIPKKLRLDSFSKSYNLLNKNGEIIIISRLPSFTFSFFYHFIKKFFGDDIRKTGIYAFWGPYKPVKKNILEDELKSVGFKVVSSKKYFFIPPFFNQAFQMFLQFVKSGGSSYLHREKHVNIFTRILNGLISSQKLRTSVFGSVLVLKAVKSERRSK